MTKFSVRPYDPACDDIENEIAAWEKNIKTIRHKRNPDGTITSEKIPPENKPAQNPKDLPAARHAGKGRKGGRR